MPQKGEKLPAAGKRSALSAYPGTIPPSLTLEAYPSEVPDTGVALHFTSGKRGSVSFQVDFSHTWFGSSVTASVREVPARKFR